MFYLRRIAGGAAVSTSFAFLFFGLLALTTTLHELGHAIVARSLSLPVKKIEIGVGSILFSQNFGSTRVYYRAIPAGGLTFSELAEDFPESFVCESAAAVRGTYCQDKWGAKAIQYYLELSGYSRAFIGKDSDAALSRVGRTPVPLWKCAVVYLAGPVFGLSPLIAIILFIVRPYSNRCVLLFLLFTPAAVSLWLLLWKVIRHRDETRTWNGQLETLPRPLSDIRDFLGGCLQSKESFRLKKHGPPVLMCLCAVFYQLDLGNLLPKFGNDLGESLLCLGLAIFPEPIKIVCTGILLCIGSAIRFVVVDSMTIVLVLLLPYFLFVVKLSRRWARALIATPL